MRRKLNRRKYERAAFHIPMNYTQLGDSNAIIEPSVTGNICEGGVSFKSNAFIPLAGRFVLEILLPSLYEPVRGISKIAWIKRLPASNQFEIGSQFLEISKKDKNRISSLIKDSSLEISD